MSEEKQKYEVAAQDNRPAAVVPFSDIEKMGTVIARSGLFGINRPEQAIALLLIAQAENLHPATAARDYHIIQGRPTLKADAMLSRFQQSGGTIKWIEMSDKKVEAEFHHPSGGTVTIDWTIERAKEAGLGVKNQRDTQQKANGMFGMWGKYPRQMLRSRVVSEGIRTVYPGIAIGIYTPEEMMDSGGKNTDYQEAEIVEQLTSADWIERLDKEDFHDVKSIDKWCFDNKSEVVKMDQVEVTKLNRYIVQMKDVLIKKASEQPPEQIECPHIPGSMMPKSDCDACDEKKDCPAHNKDENEK